MTILTTNSVTEPQCKSNLHSYSWCVRGRFQTIFGKINVIMTLGGKGDQGLDVYFVHYFEMMCELRLLSFSCDVKGGGGVKS